MEINTCPGISACESINKVFEKNNLSRINTQMGYKTHELFTSKLMSYGFSSFLYIILLAYWAVIQENVPLYFFSIMVKISPLA